MVLSTYVNQTNGSALSSANVTATNSTGIIQFTTTTDGTGWIARQEVIDYNNTGGTRTFYSNYTNNSKQIRVYKCKVKLII